jgi:hypothetical protein
MTPRTSPQRVRVVVACTSRKTLPVPAGSRVGSLSGDLVSRASTWPKVRDGSSKAVAAVDLYAGEHWQVAASIPSRAPKGWDVHLWVASAGYGLVSADSFVHPYSATFGAGQADSVVRPSDNVPHSLGAQTWWHHLTKGRRSKEPRTLAALASEEPDAPILFVGSPAYLNAVALDLQQARVNLLSQDLLTIVCCGQEGDDANVLPGDARLSHLLGGSRVSLNARLGAYVVETARHHSFMFGRVSRIVGDVLEQQPALKTFHRKTLSDSEILRFIARQPSCDNRSHTALLRRLRDEGYACEQNRFRELFLASAPKDRS